MEDIRWIRLRPAARPGRPGTRYLDRRREDRRTAGRSDRAAGAYAERLRPGRHAGRRRHALPHRRAQGEHGPQDAARGPTPAPPVMRTANTHSGTMGSVPSTFATGYKYAGLGYTTAFDAAVPPLSARHAHEEFDDTPCIDKGFYVLMGNNHYIMQALHDNSPDKAPVLRGLAARRRQGLRRQAGESGRRRGLEAPRGRQRAHGLDQLVDALRRDAAADHSRRGRRSRRAAPAAPGAHPLQQPGHARQLDDDARNDARRWKDIAATSRTSSFTATAAARATKRPSTRRPCPWPTT